MTGPLRKSWQAMWINLDLDKRGLVYSFRSRYETWLAVNSLLMYQELEKQTLDLPEPFGNRHSKGYLRILVGS